MKYLSNNNFLATAAVVFVALIVDVAADEKCRSVDATYHQSVSWEQAGQPENSDPCLTWSDSSWTVAVTSLVAVANIVFIAYLDRNKVSDSHYNDVDSNSASEDATSATGLAREPEAEMKEKQDNTAVVEVDSQESHDNGLSAEGTLNGSAYPAAKTTSETFSDGTISPQQVLSQSEVQVGGFSPRLAASPAAEGATPAAVPVDSVFTEGPAAATPIATPATQSTAPAFEGQ